MVSVAFKQLGIFLQNVISLLMLFPIDEIFVWNWSDTANIVDADDLVLLLQGIICYSVEYTPMHFQLFVG